MKEPGRTDFITLSGSGEPTLHAGLGDLVRAAKRLSEIPVAVLTNGSLLWEEVVRESLMEADLIVPSLDAGSDDVYRHINRPCGGLAFEKVVAGIVDFCSRHWEKIWLEVFLAAGVNTSEEEMKRIDTIVCKIRPAKVQFNTVDRPPAEPFAAAVSPEAMRASSKSSPISAVRPTRNAHRKRGAGYWPCLSGGPAPSRISPGA